MSALSRPLNDDAAVQCAAIIEKTIRSTEVLLSDGVVSWAVARSGVIAIIADLSRRHPAQRALVKSQLGSWIYNRDRLELETSPPAAKSALHAKGHRSRPRIAPKSLFTLVESTGSLDAHAQVEDYSVSGAKLRTQIEAAPGDQIRVGRREAVAVRLTSDGLACRFLSELPSLSAEWARPA